MKCLVFFMYSCHLMKLRYWQKAKNLCFNRYISKQRMLASVKKEIVYMADGSVDPGGLSDRLRGILSLYKMCKERNIPFKINFNHPFRLHDYFIPRDVLWDIEPSRLSFSSFEAEPIVVFCSYKKYKVPFNKEKELQYQFLDRKMASSRKKQLHIYTNAYFVNTSIEYSSLFHELFVPAKVLQEAIDCNKKVLGDKYFAFVLRFQNLLGDFKEADFQTLNADEQLKLIDKCIAKVDDIYVKHCIGKRVLVTSDSRNFLDAINKLEYVYTIPGRIIHMSYSQETDFNLHLKSFVDLMVLSEAQKIHLLVTGQMYRSGFAQTASFINNRDYEEIIF